jgi:hypothetical protein
MARVSELMASSAARKISDEVARATESAGSLTTEEDEEAF